MADIVVLGAGMVGITTALALQERGHECVVVDKNAPGLETSYGNAGLIQSEAVEPYALPVNPIDLMRMAFGLHNAVSLNPTYVMKNFRALLGYWVSSQKSRHGELSRYWAPLVQAATSHHGALAEAANANSLIKREGFWEAYRDPRRLARAVQDAERRKAVYGADFRSYDSKALSTKEPALKPGLAGAIHWPDTWSCVDPGALVTAYARLFVQRNGNIIRGDATSLEKAGDGWRVAGVEAERAVIALGPWTPQLLAKFDYAVPMISKRGYHLHFGGRHGLRRPMLLSDDSVVLSPMSKGLRIATAAELAQLPSPDLPRQLVRGERAARALLDFEEPVEARPWNGIRPCLPGMLPVIREAPRHPGLWIHFGHGHQGFTLGPVTAQLLARAMDGERSAVSNFGGPKFTFPQID